MVLNILISFVHKHARAHAHTPIQCTLPMIIPTSHTWYGFSASLIQQNFNKVRKTFKWNECLDFFQHICDRFCKVLLK